MTFFEASAKGNYNVEEAFTALAMEIKSKCGPSLPLAPPAPRAGVLRRLCSCRGAALSASAYQTTNLAPSEKSPCCY